MGMSVEARSKSSPHPKWNMTQNEILTAVIDGTLFGMIECDVGVPADLREHFAEMLPVFNNALVTRDDIGPLLRWYLTHGLVVDRVYQVIEYEANPCFQRFGNPSPQPDALVTQILTKPLLPTP